MEKSSKPAMKGGNPPRTKGYGAEREIVRICKSWGIEAKRTPTSKKPDVVINGRPVSVKRRKNGMQWAYKELEEHDYVLFRADNNKWLKISLWTVAEQVGCGMSLKTLD